jgi:hypothetical protein
MASLAARWRRLPKRLRYGIRSYAAGWLILAGGLLNLAQGAWATGFYASACGLILLISAASQRWLISAAYYRGCWAVTDALQRPDDEVGPALAATLEEPRPWDVMIIDPEDRPEAPSR